LIAAAFRRPLRWLPLLLVAAFCLTGCGGGAQAAAPAPAAVSHAAAPAAKVLPTWMDIPSIGAKSTLTQLGLNADKSIQVPPTDDPMQAGWYKFGPTPGDTGPAVILGHIDGDKKQGIFWKLHDVKVGDQVQVGRQDGKTVTFVVDKVGQVAKNTFPTDAVYGNTPDPELRLITCGGAFDASTGHYLDNFIVYAKLAA
jgi:LPXTG-site transpeptidase (sortase) family protein